MDYQERLDELREGIYHNWSQPMAVTLAAEAIRLADLHNDLEAGIEFRMEILGQSGSTGQKEHVLVHFPWLVATAKKHPDKVDESLLLYYHFNIMWSMAGFPEIPLENIFQVIGSYQELARRMNQSQRVISGNLRNISILLGDLDQAKIHHEEMLSHALPTEAERFDGRANSIAFDATWDSVFYFITEQFQKSVDAALPVVLEHVNPDNFEPSATGLVLISLLRLKRPEEGFPYLPQLLNTIRSEQTGAYPVPDLILFLAGTQNFDLFFPVFEKYHHHELNPFDGVEKLEIYISNAVAFASMQKAGFPLPKLRFSRKHPLYRSDGLFSPKELSTYYEEKARAIGKKFDERNQRPYYQWYIDWTLELVEFSRNVPIPKKFRSKMKGKASGTETS